MKITVCIEGNSGLQLNITDEWEGISKQNLKFLVDRIAKFYYLDTPDTDNHNTIDWDLADDSTY